jgi:hypothetical protein
MLLRGPRIERHLDQLERDGLARVWREVAIGAGLGDTVSTVSGITLCHPPVTAVQLHPVRSITIKLLPGQIADDVAKVAHRLTSELGCAQIRIVPLSDPRWCRLELLDTHPLAGVIPFAARAAGAGTLLGVDEHGQDVCLDWRTAPHAVIQGTTRSGKSTFLYGLIAQLVGRPDIRIAGIDPSGLLLRPFAGSVHAPRQVLGLRDLDDIETVLAELVTEMDDRTAAMPLGCDTVTTGPDLPLLIVVLEEWAGVLRALDQVDAKLGKRVRGLVSRLLCEGHKSGVRVVMVVQRAEASVIGGLERAQCDLRVTFRVDNADSVKLLHPAVGPDVVERHSTAPNGVALLTAPAVPLGGIRAPMIDYAAYTDVVRGGVSCPTAGP